VDFLSETLIVHFEPASKSLLIRHPDRDAFPDPLVTIREETYSGMSFEEACEFVGSRVMLLIPQMRQQYGDELRRLSASEQGKGFKNKR
jgi:hypothetical protein